MPNYIFCSQCGLAYYLDIPHVCTKQAEQDLAALRKFDADPINHPTHYTQGTIQPIDFIVANKLNFIEGSILKYIVRYKHKNGVEDLKKAQAYLERLIKLEEERGDK